MKKSKIKYAVGFGFLAVLVCVGLFYLSSPFAIRRLRGETGLEKPGGSGDQAEVSNKGGARDGIRKGPLDPRVGQEGWERQISRKELEKLVQASGRSPESLVFAFTLLGWDKDYLQELRTHPDDPCANTVLAIMQVDPLDRAEAASRLTKLQPDNALGYLLLAEAKTATSDFEEASSLLRQASKLKLTDIGQAAYASQFEKLDQYADPKRVNFAYLMDRDRWRNSVAVNTYSKIFDQRNFTNPDTGELDLEAYQAVSHLAESNIPATSSEPLYWIANSEKRLLTEAASHSAELPGLKEEVAAAREKTTDRLREMVTESDWERNATPAELDAKALSTRSDGTGP